MCRSPNAVRHSPCKRAFACQRAAGLLLATTGIIAVLCNYERRGRPVLASSNRRNHELVSANRDTVRRQSSIERRRNRSCQNLLEVWLSAVKRGSHNAYVRFEKRGLVNCGEGARSGDAAPKSREAGNNRGAMNRSCCYPTTERHRGGTRHSAVYRLSRQGPLRKITN
jgi:hypothetical protein